MNQSPIVVLVSPRVPQPLLLGFIEPDPTEKRREQGMRGNQTYLGSTNGVGDYANDDA